MRRIEYRLTAESPRVDIGWPLLGSMRVERDFQYQRGHLRPFGGAPFQQQELVQLIARLGRLPAAERRRHLELLHARSVGELRARLQPTFSTTTTDSSRTIRITQPYFDDRNRLVLELIVDPRVATASLRAGTVSIRSRTGRPVTLAARVSTDGPALTPLRREQIFTGEFLEFLASGGVPRGERGGCDGSPIIPETPVMRSLRS